MCIEIVNVEVDRFEIARELRGPVDVARDDVERRDPRRVQRLFRRAPRDLVEVGADDDQGVLVELRPRAVRSLTTE